MSKYIEAKKQLTTSLSEDLTGHFAFLVFEFSSINCEQMADLRRTLWKLNSKLLVRKNNIIERALDHSKLCKDFKLSGQNAVLLSTSEDLLPLKSIIEMSKKLDQIKLKLAYFDKILFENEKLDLLVNLRSKNDAIACFAQLLLQPIHKLLFLLNNIKHE